MYTVHCLLKVSRQVNTWLLLNLRKKKGKLEEMSFAVWMWRNSPSQSVSAATGVSAITRHTKVSFFFGLFLSVLVFRFCFFFFNIHFCMFLFYRDGVCLVFVRVSKKNLLIILNKGQTSLDLIVQLICLDKYSENY